jgi:hypothetical protein
MEKMLRGVSDILIDYGFSPDEHISWCWNIFLTITTCVNVFYLLAFVLRTSSKMIDSPGGFWNKIENSKKYLAAIYVIACGVRSIWPRMDGDRVCFHDHWISLVAIGRSLATVAELSYMAQLCLAVRGLTNSSTIPSVLLLANVISQSCCWYSVITQDQRGHVVEESIWMVSIAIVTNLSTKEVPLRKNKTSDASTFVKAIYISGPLYIIFMCSIDIPMYINRYIADEEKGVTYQSFYNGFIDTLHCKVISRANDYWIHEMPWMTLYFTFAVWSSLWLATSNIALVDKESNGNVDPKKNSKKLN